nr:MAG TPA: hypothetical protein [Caudoviricetes sp.]DAT69569.1 MAG TPA: hypothetical protein [Caudoviricetes sp.]
MDNSALGNYPKVLKRDDTSLRTGFLSPLLGGGFPPKLC